MTISSISSQISLLLKHRTRIFLTSGSDSFSMNCWVVLQKAWKRENINGKLRWIYYSSRLLFILKASMKKTNLRCKESNHYQSLLLSHRSLWLFLVLFGGSAGPCVHPSGSEPFGFPGSLHTHFPHIPWAVNEFSMGQGCEMPPDQIASL